MNNQELYRLARRLDIPDRALLSLREGVRVVWEANGKECTYSYRDWFPTNIEAVSVKIEGEGQYGMGFVSAANELMLPAYFSRPSRFGSMLNESWFVNSCYWHSYREGAVSIAFVWVDMGVLEMNIDGEDFSVPLNSHAVYERGER